MITRKVVEAWKGPAGLDLLALGYATPFLDDLDRDSRRIVAAMPAAQGVEPWPMGGRNRTSLTDETALPFPNALFDRILAVHALEECDHPRDLLREVWRVLAPTGRVIFTVSARHGLWANAETTPFGHGRPFSRRQLEALVREAELEPVGWTRALYAPPIPWTANWAEGFEQVGARLWPPFAGVILLEAMKQSFAVRPKGSRAPARAAARPAFAPAPVAGRISTPARQTGGNASKAGARP
jgi:SAM-dependent methyltransferase